MDGNHPKRKKSKDNPYTICKTEDNRYFISFQDGEKVLHEFEVGKELYDFFNKNELRDISQINECYRHMDYYISDEETITLKAIHRPESIDEEVSKNIKNEKLRQAILELPELQRRRLILYFFEDLTYSEIGELEGCSYQAIQHSIEKAQKNIKKFLI